MPKHKVRTIVYHTLHDSSGYTDHPNPNREPVTPVRKGNKLNGRHTHKPPSGHGRPGIT